MESCTTLDILKANDEAWLTNQPHFSVDSVTLMVREYSSQIVRMAHILKKFPIYFPKSFQRSCKLSSIKISQGTFLIRSLDGVLWHLRTASFCKPVKYVSQSALIETM